MLILCSARAYLCCVQQVLRSQLDSASANHDGTLHQLWICHATEPAAAEDRGLARGIQRKENNIIYLLLATFEIF